MCPFNFPVVPRAGLEGPLDGLVVVDGALVLHERREQRQVEQRVEELQEPPWRAMMAGDDQI